VHLYFYTFIRLYVYALFLGAASRRLFDTRLDPARDLERDLDADRALTPVRDRDRRPPETLPRPDAEPPARELERERERERVLDLLAERDDFLLPPATVATALPVIIYYMYLYKIKNYINI
jgi:hypothetical protein